MPELPEVETIRRGLEPLLLGRTVESVVLRTPCLRWPLSPRLRTVLPGRSIDALGRRAKYLLLRCGDGTLLVHLGMSGRLVVVQADRPPQRHDHVDLVLDDGRALRFTDPRRFGALLWCDGSGLDHPLLAGLGPEPLDADLSGDYLAARAAGRRLAVKSFIMDQKIVVGVGNLNASEALFRAGIDPARAAGTVTPERYRRLAAAIRAVLEEALAAGGTTLRDFRDGHGNPGYFAVQLKVYGHAGERCPQCGTTIRSQRIGQRSSYFCPRCQR